MNRSIAKTFLTRYGSTVNYQLIRSSRRRTMALEVDLQGLKVRVPQRASLKEISNLLEENTLWILQKLSQLEQRGARLSEHWPSAGDTLFFNGQPCELKLIPAQAEFPVGEVRLADGDMELAVFEDLVDSDWQLHVREPLRNWYMSQASRQIPPLAELYASQLGLDSPPVTLRDQQRQWGSCSASGEIRLNYRIVIPPEDVTRYIVAHELGHLLELNHSPRFWNIVGRLMPDYQRLRRKLRYWEPRMNL